MRSVRTLATIIQPILLIIMLKKVSIYVALLLAIYSANVAGKNRDEAKASRFANCSVIAEILAGAIEKKGLEEKRPGFTAATAKVFKDTAIQISDSDFVAQIVSKRYQELKIQFSSDKDAEIEKFFKTAENCSDLMVSELFPELYPDQYESDEKK